MCHQTQLADSLKSWFNIRDKATEDLGTELNEARCYGYISFNKNVRTKSNSYFCYETWIKKKRYKTRNQFDMHSFCQ